MFVFYILGLVYIIFGLKFSYHKGFFFARRYEKKSLFNDWVKKPKKEKLIAYFRLFIFDLVQSKNIILYPYLFVRYVIKSKMDCKNPKNIKSVAVKLDNNLRIIEEKKYLKLINRLIEIIRYKYDESGKVIEQISYDDNDFPQTTITYTYNEYGQKKSIFKYDCISHELDKQYFIYSINNKILMLVGELPSGHKYSHEYIYDKDWNHINTKFNDFIRDIDISVIFQEEQNKYNQII